MRYVFTFRSTGPNTAPVAPAHGSAGTMTRPRKIAYSQSMFPASHQAPYTNQPQTCQNRKSPARITERAIPSTKHMPKLTTLIRRIVRRRRRCQCVGREIQRSPIRSRDSIRRPNTPFLSNPHCLAPFICRTFTTVFYSAVSKNQSGFFKDPWCFFSHPCAPERSAIVRRRLRRSSK